MIMLSLIPQLFKKKLFDPIVFGLNCFGSMSLDSIILDSTPWDWIPVASSSLHLILQDSMHRFQSFWVWLFLLPLVRLLVTLVSLV